MSDVVAVGIITGLVGLAGSVVTYLIARHQADAEMAKLRAQHTEDERRHRQGIYHQLLELLMNREKAIDNLDALPVEEATQFGDQLNHLQAAVRLFGAKDVATAVAIYQAVTGQIVVEANKKNVTDATGIAQIAKGLAKPLRDAQELVVQAMRADILGDAADKSQPKQSEQAS